MRLFLILLLLPSLSVEQPILKGNIIDKKTKKGVSFATVGLIKVNIGTNAMKMENLF